MGTQLDLRQPGGTHPLAVAVLTHLRRYAEPQPLVALLLARWPPTPGRQISFGGLATVVALVVLLAMGTILLPQMLSFFNVEDLSPQSVTSVLDKTAAQTGEGSSHFTPVRVTDPLQYGLAGATVVLRPFPWEAHNNDALMSSLETVGLLVVIGFSWQRLLSVVTLWRRRGYVTFAAVFVMLFVWAFSAISNFGILVRQRSLMLPFLFVLLALPPLHSAAEAQEMADDPADEVSAEQP